MINCFIGALTFKGCSLLFGSSEDLINLIINILTCGSH